MFINSPLNSKHYHQEPMWWQEKGSQLFLHQQNTITTLLSTEQMHYFYIVYFTFRRKPTYPPTQQLGIESDGEFRLMTKLETVQWVIIKPCIEKLIKLDLFNISNSKDEQVFPFALSMKSFGEYSREWAYLRSMLSRISLLVILQKTISIVPT